MVSTDKNDSKSDDPGSKMWKVETKMASMLEIDWRAGLITARKNNIFNVTNFSFKWLDR